MWIRLRAIAMMITVTLYGMKTNIYPYFIEAVLILSNWLINFSDLWATAPETTAMVTCSPILLSSLIYVLGLLVGSSCARMISEPPANVPDDVDCHETPPDCNVSHLVTGGLPHSFMSRDRVFVDSVHHKLQINGHESVCSLDPTMFVTDTSNRSTPLNLHFEIGCHEKSTRVVIRPTRNLTSALVFAKLEIRNCTIYWKDLSTFGRHVDVRAMLLFSWMDEFAAQQPRFFTQCAEFDDLQREVEGLAGSMAGLSRVATLELSSSPTCNCTDDTPDHSSWAPSTVFTRHRWPLMAEVKFVGYVFISTGKWDDTYIPSNL